MRTERSMKYVVVAALLAFSFFMSAASVKAAPADPGADKYREGEQRVYVQNALPWWLATNSTGFTSLKGTSANMSHTSVWDSPEQRMQIRDDYMKGLSMENRGVTPQNH